MERICEPELMDDPLQAQAYAAADFDRSDADFTAWILELLAAWPAAAGFGRPLRILDLGCGPGNIAFRLAAALPEARVLAIDGAAAMLRLARERQAQDGARWRHLHLHQARLPLAPSALDDLPAEVRPPYHLLVSNSLLHHLHDPQALWRSLRPLAAASALLVLRDLRRPASRAILDKLVQQHAAAASPRLRHDFEHSLQAAFRLEEVRQQLQEAGLGSLQLAERADRYLDVWGLFDGMPERG